jgi:hypothetical protein
MDLLWATFGASGTARFPDRICEVCTAPLQHRIQLWFRPHGMMQAYGGDPSGCLLTLSHRITQSARPLWHTAQTMSHTPARARARMCARSQRSWPQVTSTCERRLASRTSIVARAQGTRGKHCTTRSRTHTKHKPNPAKQTAHEQHQRGRCSCVLLSVGVPRAIDSTHCWLEAQPFRSDRTGVQISGDEPQDVVLRQMAAHIYQGYEKDFSRSLVPVCLNLRPRHRQL